ncbi:NAD(P)-dependent alcohol dehydrogenase [Myxococcus sp. RHSTA-1-4]|uniref:NAD(P)-dependent alcohol dehydrogenase n=1 Tax=Myxococcus sp. RHSTA-1-4 TaxID=2874601 RepID=UPI001CBC3F09|nr:NAD(P)-dependent alcohol dehydrogenase [Myxococcus sp. RHSTA-1-4]MBZ4418127.1 NAD(P)-dependent alcohol dehydrogenase [Myxococcus sp. RHSTA-1-4]
MKAAVYRQYGPPEVVRIEELARPEPRENEVLIRVRASTVSSADWRVRSLKVPAGFGLFARPVLGMFGPRKAVLGTELAGEIEAVGSAVRKFKAGDAVFAFPGFDMGCHAEYRTLPEDGRIMPMPAGVSFEEAAAISFGGSTALHYLRDRAKAKPGDDVLIIGASGAVGSAAVQIAKHLGARVTGVTSTPNLERVSGLGADRVIDYTKTRFLEGGEKYDIIFDTVGSTSFSACESALKEDGRLLLSAAGLPQILASSWASRRGKKGVVSGNATESVEHLRYLKELVEAGQYRPLIDRTYPLERIVDAHAYVDAGRKRGSVVITMA